MKRRILLAIYIMVFSTPLLLQAQFAGNSTADEVDQQDALVGAPPPGGDDPGSPTNVPIDGGLSLLLAAGAAYGIKKYTHRRNTDKR